AADDAVQIGKLRFQGRRRFVENFEELLGVEPAGFLEVLDGDLHREKRIAQFVSKASGEFAPGSHALGLEKTLFLRSEGSRHVVEGDGELADFIASTNFDARIPSSGGDFAGAFGKLLDGLGDARGNPEADEQSDEKR